MVIIDTSVWLDLFLEDEERKERAEELMKAVKTVIYEPKVFKIEWLERCQEDSEGMTF